MVGTVVSRQTLIPRAIFRAVPYTRWIPSLVLALIVVLAGSGARTRPVDVPTDTPGASALVPPDSTHTDIAEGSVSGTWRVARSPYFVNGEITVPNGETLTIEPGTRVVFTGHYKFNVQGRLHAVGALEDSIWFTAEDTVAGWHGIRFINTPQTNDTSKLVYCSFTHGKANTGPENSLDRCGGAILISGCDKVLISHSLFEYNMTSGDVGSTGGPGICIFRGSPTVTNSTFSRNAGTSAGAIKIDFTSEAIIRDNIISNNVSYCGAILCAYGRDNRPRVSDNIIADNVATAGGGGIFVFGESAPCIENNVIARNRAPLGGGVYVAEFSQPLFVNNTIVKNTALGNGGGVYCIGQSAPVFINTIVFGNRAELGDQVYVEDPASRPVFQYCDIQGGLEATGGPGAGASYTGVYNENVEGDPLFADTDSGDYRLTDDSWCIGAGIDSLQLDSLRIRAPCLDHGGSIRPDPPYSRPDIGAWEHPRSVPRSLLAVAPVRHDFRTVYRGSVSDTLDVLIRNRGATPWEVASLSLGRSEFRLVPMPTLPRALPSLSEWVLRVVFCPTMPGVVRDTLEIGTTDGHASRIAIPLSGRGSAPVQSAREGVLYGVSASGGSVNLYEIDRATGRAVFSSEFLPRPPAGLSALAIRPIDATLYAAFASAGETELFRLSSEYGDLEPFNKLPLAGVTAMAFSASDRIFLVTSGKRLYHVGVQTLDTVFVGPTGYAFTGLAFSPATGALWASVRDTVCMVDTATGGITLIGRNGPTGEQSTITFSPIGTLYGLFGTSLVTIGNVWGEATVIGSTGVPGLVGIATRSDAGSLKAESSSALPREVRLLQNYPNPFNPTTVIRFELPSASDVCVAVFDLLGREVATLVDERRGPGAHSVGFDASVLACGVYVCRLSADRSVHAMRMIVVK